MMEGITVHKFKEMLDNGEEVFLLDVREPFEKFQSKIDYEHSALIPVDQLPDRVNEIENHKDDEIVCMCRSGGRSAKACEILEEKGFKNVRNLEGGINRWAKEVDNSLPVY